MIYGKLCIDESANKHPQQRVPGARHDLLRSQLRAVHVPVPQPKEVCIQNQIYLEPNQYGAGMTEPFECGIESLNTPLFDVFSTPILASPISDVIDARNVNLRKGI